jgi:hypothetical protein
MTKGMAEVVECLSSTFEALSSNPGTPKNIHSQMSLIVEQLTIHPSERYIAKKFFHFPSWMMVYHFIVIITEDNFSQKKK